MKKVITLFLLLSYTLNLQGQQIKGTVTDRNDEPIPGVKVFDKATYHETVTDFDGKFSIKIKELPTILEFSYAGFITQTVSVVGVNPIKVTLKENQEYLEKMVTSATRKSESISEVPVSIVRMGTDVIAQNTAPSFYDGLVNLKGVDLFPSSLTFNMVNTRGFAQISNIRFLQLIDGIDNASPALNFALGNIAGLNELDVDNVEILPGASSALYGSNAFNGLLSMHSKSPFKYKGVSFYVNYGQTSQEAAGINDYTAAGLRVALGGKKFAAKFNLSFLQGTDWLAVDYSDVDVDPYGINAGKYGSRASNPSYDGLNVYGDDFAVTIPLSIQTSGQLEDIRVSRTGYEERYLTDNKAKNIKGDIALHLRPSGKANSLEFIWASRFGTGKTIYAGVNRYVMDNMMMQQHKFEIKNKDFFIRAYYTGEDAGDTYDTKFTAWNINRKWRSDEDWFTDYATVYAAARLGLIPGTGGTHFDETQAHAIARNFADNSSVDLNGDPKTTRYLPGSDEFKKAFDEVTNDPNFKTGGKFVDNSNSKNIDANYSISNINFAEIQIGGSFRRLSLHSSGTIFTDYDYLDDINIDQASAYIQFAKKLIKDKLKFSTSLRYDKQKNNSGNFSPRVSMVYSVGDKKEHNFRMSYQTGFRNPTPQELYLGIDLGVISLVGSAPDNLERYHEKVVATDTGTGADFEADISGTDAYVNSYTLDSFIAYNAALQAGDPNAESYLQKADINLIAPEQISTYEFGYRGKISSKLRLDISAYYNFYNNFAIGKKVVALSHEVGDVDDATAHNAIASGAYKQMAVYTNAENEVRSYGVDAGLDYTINDYKFQFIYNYAKLDIEEDVTDLELRTGFNLPEHNFKFSFGNPKLFKNFGFNLNLRYQTEFKWEGSFADGMVPARTILDAQLNYNIRKYHSQIKIGGTNLLGEEYISSPGNGLIGSIYYIKFTYSK